MSAPLRQPWTQDRFLDWAETQDARHEFDGYGPVAMTGGNANHSRITANLHVALWSRLRGTPCSYFGPDLGIATIGNIIRFPDALITCTAFPGRARLAPDPVAVFEVLSPSSMRIDRIVKVREYGAVASIRYYAILESTGVGLTLLTKQPPHWQADVLAEGDTLELPSLGLTIPLSEFYEGVAFDDADVA